MSVLVAKLETTTDAVLKILPHVLQISEDITYIRQFGCPAVKEEEEVVVEATMMEENKEILQHTLLMG